MIEEGISPEEKPLGKRTAGHLERCEQYGELINKLKV